MNKSTKRLLLTLGVLQAFIALGALPAGYSMITFPDGSGLGMTLAVLENSPFKSYLVPGLFLFIINGLFNILASIFSFIKHPFSGFIGLTLGIFLTLWICIQVYFIGLISFLQPLMFVIGLIEIMISYLIFKHLSLKSN